MTTQKHLLLSLLFCTFSYSSFTQIIYVNQATLTGSHNGTSWDNAFIDIQNALTIAQTGDQIWVAQGTYLPTQSLIQTASFELEDGVEMYGGFIGTETILEERDWQNNLTVLSGDLLHNDEEDFTNIEDNSYCIIYSNMVSSATVVDGFTISGAYANDPEASSQSRGQSGAAWFNRGSFGLSNPTVRNCMFINNKANYFGGALYNNGSFNGITNMTLENCQFINNHSVQSGGSIYNNGSFGGESNATFERCVFKNNHAIAGSGGVMYNNGAQGETNPVFTNCIFADNKSGNYGGVFYNMGKGDLAPLTDGDASPIFINCLMTNNKALSAGVMYNLGSENGRSNPQLINCTLYNNFGQVSAGALNNNAGGMDDLGTSHATVSNSIFWNNRTNGIGPVFKNNNGGTTVENCLISEADCDGLNIGTGSTINCNSENIFNEYPLFADTMNGDFSLLDLSPAHNEGDNSRLPVHILDDLAGKERIAEDIIDIGAYEICGMSCEVLPVDIMAFLASIKAATMVQLDWQVASEKQVDFYDLERSQNARFFQTIAKRSAISSGLDMRRYAVLDNYPPQGENYYRLKVVYLDGTFEYSHVEMIDLSQEQNPITIYPNPTEGQFKLDMGFDIKRLERVMVYDAFGRLVYEDDLVLLSNSIMLENIVSGVYELVIELLNGQRYVKHLVVKK